MILPFGSEAVKIVTVHPRHSQNRVFDALRCFVAHFCLQKGTSEL